MQGLAVLLNQPQVGIAGGRRLEGADPLLSSLEGSVLRRNDLFVEPRLEEDIGQEIPNGGGPENGLRNNPEDVPHVVAGPLVTGNPAAGIEGEEVDLHAPLQRREEEDLQAVRNLLNLLIEENVITAQHLWQIMHNLRAILPEEGPYRIRSSQAEYARILRRTARVMTVPSKEMFETAPGPHQALGFDTLFEALQRSTPVCPTDYGECLDSLCDHMTAGASFMPGADAVFVFKDHEEFGTSLQSLAARLTSVN